VPITPLDADCGFYTEPPAVKHFAMTKPESVVIQISGNDPSSTTYADPLKDPGETVSDKSEVVLARPVR